MRYVMSVDLGSEQDYTAISIVKRVEKKKDPNIPAKGMWVPKKQPIMIINELQLFDLQRIPLKTPYPVICQKIKEVLNNPQFVGQIQLIVDRTGVGIPVSQMMMQYGLNPIGITIHGGDRVITSKDVYSVPKRDLATALLVAYQTKRFRCPPPSQMPIVRTFAEELQGFIMKINSQTGHDSYEAWMEKIHDDLVMSVAMAVWWFDMTHGTSTVLEEGQ